VRRWRWRWLACFGPPRSAQAAHCGNTGFGVLKRPACDAQCCFNACQQQTRTCYKLVWDTVTEKRFHVCHQTVC